jgi:ATP-dependent exoDNAse (exonuclease V) alpha subunit
MIDQNTIKNLRQNGLLREIDIHFARFISGFSAVKDPDVFLAAALVSHATGTGDICLNLETAAGHLLSSTKDIRNSIECPG